MQRQKSSQWAAVAFCTFLSVMALIGTVTEKMWGDLGGWWKPAFFGFLPMCFVFLAFTMSSMQHEINELRTRLQTAESAAKNAARN